jgi:mannose-1-phosphate guanylyltransferase
MLKTVSAGFDFIPAESQYYSTSDAYGNAEDEEKAVRQEAKQLKKLLENKKMDYAMFQKTQKARMGKSNKKNSDDKKQALKENLNKTKALEKRLKASMELEKKAAAIAENQKQKHKKTLLGK